MGRVLTKLACRRLWRCLFQSGARSAADGSSAAFESDARHVAEISTTASQSSIQEQTSQSSPSATGASVVVATSAAIGQANSNITTTTADAVQTPTARDPRVSERKTTTDTQIHEAGHGSRVEAAIGSTSTTEKGALPTPPLSSPRAPQATVGSSAPTRPPKQTPTSSPQAGLDYVLSPSPWPKPSLLKKLLVNEVEVSFGRRSSPTVDDLAIGPPLDSAHPPH